MTDACTASSVKRSAMRQTDEVGRGIAINRQRRSRDPLLCPMSPSRGRGRALRRAFLRHGVVAAIPLLASHQTMTQIPSGPSDQRDVVADVLLYRFES